MDNYKLTVEYGHSCEFCGWDAPIILEIWKKENDKLRIVYSFDNFYIEDDINDFREIVQAKLDELGISRDLSSDYIGDWEDED
jgi:hypothetical protein